MDTPDGRSWLPIALIALLALLRAWFSVCETALTEINDAVVHARAETDRKWKAADALVSAPARMRRCFTMHRIFSAVLMGMLCWLLFGGQVRQLFPFPGGTSAAAFLLTLALTLAMAVLTDIYPKRIARHFSERLVLLCVPTARILIAVFAPCRAAASGVTALLCRLTGIPVSDGVDVVTEEEIRLLVDAGNETGGIEESQREMINNIFTFDDVPVSDVMTHRRDMAAVSLDETVVHTAALAGEKGFSRIPVYEGSIDRIVGALLVKDLLPLIGKPEDCSVRDRMRPVIFVPETAKCRDVFQRMRREKQQIAIVSDEYGGTAGMVTMEDLIEEIVGSIQDEYDNEEAELTELSAGVFSVAGSADPEDILPRLGVSVPPDDTFDTMSAFVVHLLGHIPADGEQAAAEQDGVRYTPLSFEDNWISRIRAELLPQEE